MTTVVSDNEAKGNIAANVMRLLEIMDWSQADLARATDESTMRISILCRGTKEPRAGVLARVAEALGVSVDDLLAEPPAKKSSRKSA